MVELCVLESKTATVESIKWKPWQKCPLYGDVLFLESPSNNQKSLEVNMEPAICHDFQAQIYWKDQKTGRLGKMRSFFHSKICKQDLLH